MLHKRIILLLTGITASLLIAVIAVVTLQNRQAFKQAAFLPVHDQTKTAEQAAGLQDEQKAKTSLSTLALDSLSDQTEQKFADRFNRANTEAATMMDATKMKETQKVEVEEIETLADEERSDPSQKVLSRTEKQSIPFETLEYEADWVKPGEQVITLAGEEGLALVYYEDTYQDDVLISSIEVDREIIAQPVRCEIAVGRVVQMDNPDPEQPKIDPEQPEPEIEVKPAPTEPDIIAPEPTEPAVPSEIQFVPAGSNSAAFENHAKIASMLKSNGNQNYLSYTDNGNNTITVDGVTFAYDYTTTSTITGYDGQELNSYRTASGMATQRGLVATVFPDYGGYPMGTVLFIDGFGLVVVADYNGMGKYDPSWLDVCFTDGDINNGYADPGKTSKTVYVLSMP